jgi:tetratricopeptide (TPR) repeat protein
LLAAAGSYGTVTAQTAPEQNALALEQQGKTREAEAAWTGLSDRDPANPIPWAHLGLLAARQEHFLQAVGFYKKALALNPEMPGLRLNLGLALFKNGDYREALVFFTPLLKEQPDASDEKQRLAVLIGMSHYGLGDYAAAAPYLREASARDVGNLTLLLTLAHSCLLSKQYPCVVDAYHRMVVLNADSAEAHILVGEALDEMKDSAGAIREFRAALKANPQEPNAHFGLGYLLWTQKEYPEAAQEFQAELADVPGYTQATLYLADSYVQMNEMDKAQPLLEALVKGNPSLALARLDLGIAEEELGHKDAALRDLNAAAALDPKNVNVYWRLGRVYRSMGKEAEAKKEFDQARSLNEAADARLLEVLQKDQGKGTLPVENHPEK